MDEPAWNKFLTERDKQVFEAAGYGARAGFGKRPVLLVVDANYAFVSDKREPILESIKRWVHSCGEEGWDSVQVIKKLVLSARGKGLPVIYTSGVRRPDGWDGGGWAWKNNRNWQRPHKKETTLDGSEIMPDIAPGPKDIVIKKQKPSAFFGTNLLSYLVLLGADSLIVTGSTTSGCVRASVLDAFSNNYRVTVVEDGCFDRSQASHAINLCDMNAKYADVIKSDEVLAYFEMLESDMFDLPKGDPRPA
jgi:nicotinamidase-related amidase